MPHLRARLLLIASLAMTLAVPVPARAATQVSYPALLHQIESGPLIRAIINRRAGHIEIKFRDLSEWEASYPRGAQRQLQRLLHERHIGVIFASRHRAARAKPRSVHHHLRYIAAGILGALVLGGGASLYLRRRRAGEPASGNESASAS
jgi:hypothetical protein